MKRIFCSLFLAALLLYLPIPAVRAEGTDPPVEIETPYYIVVDAIDPSVVFFERNADERVIPGSTMKIMTCILALELCQDLDNTLVVATGAAANMEKTNSLMGVIKGETLTMRQLIYGLMLESGNDAAMLIAQKLGGDVAGFVAIMNEKAAALGMKDTNFSNASGAFRGTQYSTARDMAILTCYAMQNPLFAEIVSTVHYTIPANGVRGYDMEMTNTNALISNPVGSDTYYELAVGVKTGSTVQGGKCLVAAASDDGNTAIAILLGLKEGGGRLKRMNTVYLESKALLDLALKQGYQTVTPAELKLDVLTSVPVSGGEKETVPVKINGEPSTRLPVSLIARIQSDPTLVTISTDMNVLAAPVAAGDLVGSITYAYGDHTLFTAACSAAEDVPLPATPEPERIMIVSSEPTAGDIAISQPSAPAFPRYVVPLALGLLLCITILLFILHDRKKKRLPNKDAG